MHFITAKHALSSKNGINIYRGCTHGCIYCDSRSDCYNLNHEFTNVGVKENIIDLLDIELMRKRKKIMIGVGSMSDPYLHCEKELKYTRRMLELALKYGHGVNILTKSDLVLRDLELLVEINKHSKVVVSMTLTTFDEELSSKTEENVCNTKRRIEVLEILHNAGIEVGVWFGPFLPYITDGVDNFLDLLEESKRIGASYILCFGIGLTLRPGNREYFYEKLDQHFVGLKDIYRKEFKDYYNVGSKNHFYLMNTYEDFCKRNNIIYGIDSCFKFMSEYENHEYEQLSLF